MKKLIKLILPLSALLFFIVACASPGNDTESKSLPTEGSSSDQEIQVVTSIFPMYEMVKEVAGDRADVSLMVGANEDAHHYEPSAQAVASVNEADVFVYSSKVMEFWVESMLDVVENENLQVVEVGENVDLEIDNHGHNEHEEKDTDHDHDHDHGDLDPHFWLDLAVMNDQLPLIVEALSEVDPDGADDYAENAETFSQELLELDQAYQEAFHTADQRIFVVQHQAFGHLASRYHLDQVSVGGLMTEVEASPKKLAEMIEFVEDQNVPVIYYQGGDNSGVAETIAAETGTESEILHDLESQPIGLENDGNLYLEAMRENLEQLKKSIQ